MSAQKWKIVPFNPGDEHYSIPVDGGAVGMASTEVFPVRDFKNRKRLVVKRGYLCFWAKPDTPDNTTQIVFDQDTGRAYYCHTTY
jgi:hypothetical protein